MLNDVIPRNQTERLFLQISRYSGVACKKLYHVLVYSGEGEPTLNSGSNTTGYQNGSFCSAKMHSFGVASEKSYTKFRNLGQIIERRAYDSKYNNISRLLFLYGFCSVILMNNTAVLFIFFYWNFTFTTVYMFSYLTTSLFTIFLGKHLNAI